MQPIFVTSAIWIYVFITFPTPYDIDKPPDTVFYINTIVKYYFQAWAYIGTIYTNLNRAQVLDNLPASCQKWN